MYYNGVSFLNSLPGTLKVEIRFQVFHPALSIGMLAYIEISVRRERCVTLCPDGPGQVRASQSSVLEGTDLLLELGSLKVRSRQPRTLLVYRVVSLEAAATSHVPLLRLVLS